MRLVPHSWSTETWVCSLRGHVAPAARVVAVRPEDHRLGVVLDAADGSRLARCLRCDAWVEATAPAAGADGVTDVLPPLAELPKPRRGRVLDDAVALRLIAVIKAAHAVVFGILSLALAVLVFKLPGMQDSAQTLSDQLHSVAEQTGRSESRDLLAEALHRVVGLHRSVLTLLLATAVIYFVMETIETIGLWKERRWAEYLTVVATAGLLPFELHELAERITVFRITALIVNLAILVWLVWNKRLFGLRGGRQALETTTDWEAVLAASPAPTPR